jgi:hypothetical protein
MEPKYNRLAAGPRRVLALTSVVSLMVSLDSQVVATALPVISCTCTPRWPHWNGR